MKILLISDVYFPRVNGVSTSIKTFVEQIQALGHTVHLIAPDYSTFHQALDQEAQEDQKNWLKRIAARKIYFDPEDRLMKLSAIHALMPTLIQEKYDLVHIHTPFIAHYAGLKIAKALSVPCVETYHTFFEDYLHHYLPWIPTSIARSLARFISKQQCNAVDAIVAPSKPMLDVLRSYGVKAEAEVIPTGLQAASFNQAGQVNFREKYHIPHNRPMLLYVGRVAFEKNIDFLLSVVHTLKDEMPEILLVITGEGPAEASLHKQVRNLSLEKNVKFIGYLDRETELNACYRAADIFVFASTSETQGLVLLEAMAQGTPVVAIAELGTASILVEGRGALIAQEEPLDFADKVQQLLHDRVRREALGLKALQYAQEEWTAQIQAERMVNFYAKTIQKHQYKRVSLEVAEPV